MTSTLYSSRTPSSTSRSPKPNSGSGGTGRSRNPVTVLAAGGNESAYFHDARLPLLKNLADQRAASASTFAFLSSAVELYPHQVRAALTVLSDPVQRYLLADEVGLGKTIEAGFVIRQTLLDHPDARIVILAPDALRPQWAQELREKFFIDRFPRRPGQVGRPRGTGTVGGLSRVRTRDRRRGPQGG